MAPVALTQTHSYSTGIVSSKPSSSSTITPMAPTLKVNGVGASKPALKPTTTTTSTKALHVVNDSTYPVLRSPPERAEGDFAFDSMEDALAAFARGEFLVVMDDEDRENEGDLIIAAEKVTTEKMAWMVRHTSGYICIGMPGERLDELEIPLMVPNNQERHRTAYTVTVDYRHGTTTGISAHDRALTARSLVSRTCTSADFARPGHLVPLRARPGGVLERRGHTEAAADLCRLAGLGEGGGGVLCELVNEDVGGTMARRDECRRFADRWGLRMVSVEMVRRWRLSLGEGLGVGGEGKGSVEGGKEKGGL